MSIPILGNLSDRTAGSGVIGDRTADSGDLGDHIAGVSILGTSTESESRQVIGNMQSRNRRLNLPCNSISEDEKWLNTHINRAEVIGHYGDAIKKFDWLIYLAAGFVLLIISLLACHFFGTQAAITSLCTTVANAAIYLLKKKTG